MRIRLILKVFIFTFFLHVGIRFAVADSSADSSVEQGRHEAENDFAASGPHLAGYGGIACILGLGLSADEKRLFEGTKPGPSRCGCDQTELDKSEKFVRSYNLRMLELLKGTKKEAPNKTPSAP